MGRKPPVVTVRSSSLDEASDKHAERGSPPWCRYFAHQAKNLRHDLTREVKTLKMVLQDLEQERAWKALGYASHSMFCLKECDLDSRQVDLILTADDHTATGAVLGSHGGDRRSQKARDNQGNRITLKQRGTSAAYYRALLERDHKDILARLNAGEFKSVRAAVRAAGIVRPTATFPTDSPADAARAILKHFQGERLAAFKRALDLLAQDPPPA
jgi:hypothetical protein